MFTTFVGISPPTDQTTNTSSSSTPSATSAPSPVRPKRAQVARACDWCRVHRIKCDSNHPCHNCKSRGAHCSKRSSNTVRTLPQALREIERLHQRIKELEVQLERPRNAAPLPLSPSLSPSMATLNALDALGKSEARRLAGGGQGPAPGAGPSRKFWEGIHTNSGRSDQTQWYGPSSAFYFIGRMSTYLGSALGRPQFAYRLQPNSASLAFSSPTSPKRDSNSGSSSASINGGGGGSSQLEDQSILPDDLPFEGTYLTGTQEGFFLSLFWQSYHCTIQIVDELEFREHYKSLWIDSSTERRPSALVDIILALCMQYGLACVPNNDATQTILPKVNVDSSDASLAGRWYYRRSQMLLTSELESPSIATLQCHVFSVLYLYNASFQNMAHITLALAVRTAHILGLHLEPPEDMPRSQRELRRRIWWTLYTLESKTCMKLGRPWASPDASVSCQLPADDHELALLSGSNFALYGDNVTWLTYSRINTKLVLAAQLVYVAFYDKCAETLAANGGQLLYSDLKSLETCAAFLTARMDTMQVWLRNVPDALKAKRKDGGETFSTDGSVLDIEQFTPLWLQRQRILLELLYHSLCMNLYRPFICFPGSNIAESVAPTTSAIDGHATACVNHAISITNIICQIVTTSDILSGWYEAFHWQWDATLSMVGFILAYPGHPATPTARAGIDNAITIFETFGHNFAVAASAANVTRDLTAQADFLLYRYQAGSATSTPSFHDSGSICFQDAFVPGSAGHTNGGPGIDDTLISPDDAQSEIFQNSLADAVGLAHSADSFYAFEPLYAGSRNLADAWVFTQE